jgi:hypothetical protein
MRYLLASLQLLELYMFVLMVVALVVVELI